MSSQYSSDDIARYQVSQHCSRPTYTQKSVSNLAQQLTDVRSLYKGPENSMDFAVTLRFIE